MIFFQLLLMILMILLRQSAGLEGSAGRLQWCTVHFSALFAPYGRSGRLPTRERQRFRHRRVCLACQHPYAHGPGPWHAAIPGCLLGWLVVLCPMRRQVAGARHRPCGERRRRFEPGLLALARATGPLTSRRRGVLQRAVTVGQLVVHARRLRQSLPCNYRHGSNTQILYLPILLYISSTSSSPTARLAMGSLAQKSSGAIRRSCNPRFRRRFRKVAEGSAAESWWGSRGFRRRKLMRFRRVLVQKADEVKVLAQKADEVPGGSGAESCWSSRGFRRRDLMRFRRVPAQMADKVPAGSGTDGWLGSGWFWRR